MLRVRFYANADDWRPVKFPPPGPAWCTGYTVNNDFSYRESIVVAYVNNEDEIKEYWPEARIDDIQGADEIIFTDRFARPDWWPEGKLTLDGGNNTNE